MQSQRRILLVFMVGFWMALMNRGVQASHICQDACDGAACDAECWLTQFDFDNEYPPTTCGEQSYSCCGDGTCDSGSEYCGSCLSDCGGSPTCESECTWSFQCGTGEVCNSSHQCVLPASNSGETGTSCSNKGDCYTPDACMSSGECAIPHSDECDEGYSCPNTPWCRVNVSNYSYCNPGNNKCMWESQPGCPVPPPS